MSARRFALSDLVALVERLHHTGHAPPVDVAVTAARAGRLYSVDTGSAGEDSILDADSAEDALDEVADHCNYPRRFAHEGGETMTGVTVRVWTVERISIDEGGAL